MNSRLSHSWAPSPSWLRFLVIVLLLLGVFFRFVNLDRKVYWFDETFTSLRISGYTETEAIENVCDGREIGIEDLQKYQRITPAKTWKDTINSLVVEDPQHPPLYYLMARFWVQWFGSSVAVTRSLSVLISLLVFPCIYWLCIELFQFSLVAWVAIALLAVSPFHVLYAQEARQYGLWTVIILLSSATLLRAMRLKTKLSWGIYAATVVIGLYTFLFSGLVTIAHGIYVFTTAKLRFTKMVIAYLLAVLAGLLAFTPWILVIMTKSTQLHKATSWTYELRYSLLQMIKQWVLNLSYFFVDFDYDLQRVYDGSISKLMVRILIPFILILVGYSIYFLCRKAQKQAWLFVLTLIGATALPLAIPDIILGGARTQVPRYLIPAFLGIQLAVSYLLATQITSTYVSVYVSVNIWRQKFWQFVMIGLLSVGVISCVVMSQAESWWSKDLNIYTPQVARIISQASQPLLITSCQGIWPLGDELSLSYLLAPKVRLQLVKEPNLPKISNRFSDVFLYNPNHNPPLQILFEQIEKELKYKFENVSPDQLKLLRLVPILRN
ncbi:glycosyltransferase family 39 protein [Brasilonema sp. UFV-L1]|uniref:glycosyltransferase family 39 protein n=1 Tax=Brasilonema sp. UFV-L1 TaxID=2234130 RepID=UPI00145F514B|nr:glycosyltransferase family 39 protein [Brasilonema sp. UFV-L1]NMG08142.1 hypothetical protein [Brasilonema sp. UFV-L1]